MIQKAQPRPARRSRPGVSLPRRASPGCRGGRAVSMDGPGPGCRLPATGERSQAMRMRTVFGLAVSVTALAAMQDGAAVGKGKRKGPVRAEVVRSAVPLSAAAATDVGPSRFSPQFRLGYTVGDQWE